MITDKQAITTTDGWELYRCRRSGASLCYSEEMLQYGGGEYPVQMEIPHFLRFASVESAEQAEVL